MKSYLLFLILLISASTFAITQKGYVRTITRPNSVSQRLQGVVIRAKGKPNGVVTDNQGNFEIAFDGLKNGEAYSFLAVMKSGYDLQEKEMIGRAHACSDIVPVEILMVNREELARERMLIEETARQKLEIAYTYKLNSLDSALQQHTLQEQEYVQQIEQLNELYQRFEPLLNAMADRYARTDYAGLDSLTRQINLAVERGDIDEAERLLLKKGNMAQRESLILSRMEAERNATHMLDSIKKETLKSLRELADDYYHFYSIHLMRFANDSARYYILKRAELDTTNVDYQLEAAQFLQDFTMEYELSIQYDERAMRNSISQNGGAYGDVATAYNDIALSCQYMGRLDDAELYMEKALQIRMELRGAKDKSIAESYNNIGCICLERGDYAKAQKCFQKAVKIRSALTGSDNRYELAKCELNLASVYVQLSKNDKAIDVLLRILPVLTLHDGENSTEVANCYNSLGAAYFYTKTYEESAQCFEKAYMIFRQIKGESHDQTQKTKGNLDAVKALIE